MESDIKNIIKEVEEVKYDENLEQHLVVCIASGDFNTLQAEQKAVCDVLKKQQDLRAYLKASVKRMKLANERMRQCAGQGLIFKQDDIDWVNAQIMKVEANLAYYDARLSVIDGILEGEAEGGRA